MTVTELLEFRRVVDNTSRHAQPIADTADISATDRGHRRLRDVPLLNGQSDVTSVAAYQDWALAFPTSDDAYLERCRLHDYARTSADWFWECDADLKLTFVSDRLMAILERPTSEIVGQSLDKIGQLLPNAAGVRPMLQAHQNRAAFSQQMITLPRPFLPSVTAMVSGVPVHDAKGRFCGYRGAGVEGRPAVLLDLVEKGLVPSPEPSAVAPAQDEFLAAISHELRTPLNAILRFAETMELQVFGVLDERYVAYARDISTASQHLLSLVDRVLDVSALEAGQMTVTQEPLNLSALIAQARTLVSMRAEAKQLDLSQLHVPQEVRVLADELRTFQILVNLLTNAVKFTPEGGRVGVETTLRVQQGLVALSFWDSGPGVAREDQDRVFKKFHQGGSEKGLQGEKGLQAEKRFQKSEGVGLGLHISRELARLMGGDIILESRAGQGARFILTLPAA